MKRLLCTLAALCAALTAIYAQTSLLGTYKATETSKYRTENCRISGMKLSSAFTLGSPEGGLISDNVKGTASFNIGGGYEKITFVVGPNSSGEAPLSDNSLVTVRADGRIVFDDVVFASDAPRFFILDIKAAKQLVFSVVRGSVEVTFANVKLWKAGQSVSNPNSLYPKLPSGKVKLVRELAYYNKSSGGYVKPVLGDRFKTSMSEVKTIMVSSKEYDSGLAFSIDQALMGKTMGHASFWLNKRFEKVSFIAGARDNQSSNASVWLVVKGDRKTLYEECIRQNELSRQIVIDVKGVESLTISTEYRSSDFLGGMTLAVVDIYAYRAGDGSVPVPGTVNPNKERIAQLPDVCPLMSSIRPFSVRGVSKANSTLFEGESRHYTFSMGGTKYWEGLLLTTGNTLLGDRIDSYAAFDLAGEYDWISFDAGCLSKRSYMDDDNLLIYVDDQLVFDRKIYSTWPSQHYRIPVYKCRTLKFARRGTGKEKQTVIGVGDIILYRGEPVDNDLFVREVPDAPYETDLIDFCGRPYFHYNGRFVSDLTSFSMDDCFLDGSTITRSFRMKDGREINKGFMLETNIPLGLENVTVMDAVFMLLTGVGASVSSSDVAAYTGVSAGASGTVNMGISLLLNDSSNKQAAAAAFNPMGEYESCTFTVENMREYVDEFAEVFGNMTRENVLNAVKLNVMADRVLVGEFWLDNKMDPLTVTVPIFKCRQLMFWLECGDIRSGQYLFHDLKLSKSPCHLPIPDSYTPSGSANVSSGSAKASSGSANDSLGSAKVPAGYAAAARGDAAARGASAARSETAARGGKKSKKEAKVEPRVEWEVKYYSSGVSAIDSYLSDVNKAWKATKEYQNGAYSMPSSSETFVQASDGKVYKCFSFVDSRGARLSISDMISKLEARISEGKSVIDDISFAKLGVASAGVGLVSLKSLEDMSIYGKLLKIAPKALNQCSSDVNLSIAQSQAMIDAFNMYRSLALEVDGKSSSDTVLILPAGGSDQIPQALQRLEYFDF